MNSRQAINLLKGLEQSLDDYCELNDEGKAAFRMAITALELFGNAEQLPSAQPGCEDTVYRKAVQMLLAYFVPEERYAEAVDGLRRLPSAQPERCEYYALCRHGRDESKLRARLKFCEYCNEDSDGYVTPIEKNNHAFVRFGMNGWELDLKANGWHGSAKIRYCPMCGRDLLVK